MRILAIDPGFERVGIAVLEKNKIGEKLVYSDCFKTSPKELFAKRLVMIGKEIERIITKEKPNCLAIETLFFNKNQKTAMQVAEARGAVLYIAANSGLAIHEYTPLQIKIAITGHGHAPKPQVDSMVRALISISSEKKIDDEMDAIAIGLTCAASTRSNP